MNNRELKELVKLITRKILKEYSMMSSTSSTSTNSTDPKDDPNTPPEDAMTSAEKAKREREADKSKLRNIRTMDLKVKGTKKQTDYFNQQLKQNKLQQTAQEKELQNLRAGKTISTGGAGSISP